MFGNFRAGLIVAGAAGIARSDLDLRNPAAFAPNGGFGAFLNPRMKRFGGFAIHRGRGAEAHAANGGNAHGVFHAAALETPWNGGNGAALDRIDPADRARFALNGGVWRAVFGARAEYLGKAARAGEGAGAARISGGSGAGAATVALKLRELAMGSGMLVPGRGSGMGERVISPAMAPAPHRIKASAAICARALKASWTRGQNLARRYLGPLQ
jgi:hypothetical protein